MSAPELSADIVPRCPRTRCGGALVEVEESESGGLWGPRMVPLGRHLECDRCGRSVPLTTNRGESPAGGTS